MIGAARFGMMGGGDFSPDSLFAAGEQGVWFDPSDFSTLFQDAAGTTPVTAVDQPVGKILDKSGRGNHATQATNTDYRPVLKQDENGCYYLLFDGSNDYLVTGSINFTATYNMTAWAGIRKLSDAARGTVFELSASSGTNSGTFFIAAPINAGIADYGVYSHGTLILAAIQSTTSFTAPTTNVLTEIADISSPVVTLRVNGVLNVTSAINQGTGTYGNYPLYIGMRGGITLPFNGRLYALIVRSITSTNTQIEQAEAWVNRKTRAY